MENTNIIKLTPYGVDGQLLRTLPPPGKWYCNSRFFPLDLVFWSRLGFWVFLQEIWVYFAKSQWQHWTKYVRRVTGDANMMWFLSAVIPITRTDIKNLLHTKVRYCSVVSESVVICQLTLKMAEKIDFENWRISNFKGLVTLTLDRVIRHTIVHHSSTSTYIQNFIGIGKTFCGRTLSTLLELT